MTRLRAWTSVAAPLKVHQRFGDIPAPPCGELHIPAREKTQCRLDVSLKALAGLSSVLEAGTQITQQAPCVCVCVWCSWRHIPSIWVSLPTVKLSSLEARSTRPGALKRSTGRWDNFREMCVRVRVSIYHNPSLNALWDICNVFFQNVTLQLYRATKQPQQEVMRRKQ